RLVSLPVSPDTPPTPVVSPNDRITLYKYDALNRLIQVTDALGTGIRKTNYDAVGNVTSRTDENNHTINYAYDANDRMTAKLTAEGYLTTFEYDAVGNYTATRAYTQKYSLGNGGVMPTPPAGEEAPTALYTYDLEDRPPSGVNP